jgi:surface antigen Omp85-like protein
MVRLVPLLSAALVGAAAPPSVAAASAPEGALAPVLAAAQSETAPPEAPPPEAPGAPAAATGAARAEKAPGRRTWFALPMIFWLPETKLGLAGAGGLHFHMPGTTESSNAFLVAGAAMEGQWSVDLATDLELRGGTLVTGRLRGVYYPDTFYGIGPETTVDQREELTRRFLEASFSVDLPLHGRRLRAGPRVQARAEDITDATPGGLVATNQVEGANGFTAVGLGLGLTWDSRDHPLWPTRGSFAQAQYMYYPSSLGRNDGFGRGSAEGRLFFALPHDRVLGLAAQLEQAHGATPFSILAKLGSTRYLRGILEGRYRDNVAWATQAELRTPVWWRFFATAFAAVGDVAPDLASLQLETLKVAGGAGVRYRLTDEGANVRLDVAASRDGPLVYLLLLEAF